MFEFAMSYAQFSELHMSLSSSLETEGPVLCFPLTLLILKSQECFLHRVQVCYLPLCSARDWHHRFHLSFASVPHKKAGLCGELKWHHIIILGYVRCCRAVSKGSTSFVRLRPGPDLGFESEQR